MASTQQVQAIWHTVLIELHNSEFYLAPVLPHVYTSTFCSIKYSVYNAVTHIIHFIILFRIHWTHH